MSALRGVVFLNGRLVPAMRARVSVFDRGLLYGDGLFETVRTYRGEPFALDEHLERLKASCEFLGIPFPAIDWTKQVRAVVRRNRLVQRDAWARLTVTRGAAAPGLLPPPRPTPTVLIIAGPLDAAVARLRRTGAPVVLLPLSREGFLAEHKTIDYLPGVLGKTIVARHHAFEGLYVRPDGVVPEGTTANLFVVRRKRLITPPLRGILPGVTRQHVLDLASRAGMRVEEHTLPATQLGRADEVFITSALVEVLPVTRIDEQPVGGGTVGPVTRHLQHLYRRFVTERLAGKG